MDTQTALNALVVLGAAGIVAMWVGALARCMVLAWIGAGATAIFALGIYLVYLA